MEVLMTLFYIDSGSLHPFAKMIEGGRGQGQGGNQQEDNKLQINKSNPSAHLVVAHFRMTLK